MNIIENAKDIASIVKKIGNLELERKVLDLQGQIIELTESNRQLVDQCRELKEKLRFKRKMIFQEPFWYAKGDPAPFCPCCWERDRLALHLIGPSAQGVHSCPSCKTMYNKYNGLIGRVT